MLMWITVRQHHSKEKTYDRCVSEHYYLTDIAEALAIGTGIQAEVETTQGEQWSDCLEAHHL